MGGGGEDILQLCTALKTLMVGLIFNVYVNKILKHNYRMDYEAFHSDDGF